MYCPYVTHPLWPKDKICTDCAKQAGRCVACERPCGIGSEIASERDGRETLFLCRRCRASGVIRTKEDFVVIVKGALHYLKINPDFEIDIERLVTIAFPNSVEEARQAGRAGHSWRRKPRVNLIQVPLHDLSIQLPGVCPSVDGWTEHLVFGKFEPLAEDFMISVAQGLPLEVVTSVILHELLHVHIALSVMQNCIPEEWEEGLCNTATLAYLENVIESLADNNDPISVTRSELAKFRRDRFLAGDTFGTFRLERCYGMIKDLNYKDVLKGMSNSDTCDYYFHGGCYHPNPFPADTLQIHNLTSYVKRPSPR